MIKHSHMVDYSWDSMSSRADQEGRKAARAKWNPVEGLRKPELPGIQAGMPMQNGRVQDINKKGCMLTDVIYQFGKFSESTLPDRRIHPCNPIIKPCD